MEWTTMHWLASLLAAFKHLMEATPFAVSVAGLPLCVSFWLVAGVLMLFAECLRFISFVRRKKEKKRNDKCGVMCVFFDVYV